MSYQTNYVVYQASVYCIIKSVEFEIYSRLIFIFDLKGMRYIEFDKKVNLSELLMVMRKNYVVRRKIFFFGLENNRKQIISDGINLFFRRAI